MKQIFLFLFLFADIGLLKVSAQGNDRIRNESRKKPESGGQKPASKPGVSGGGSSGSPEIPASACADACNCSVYLFQIPVMIIEGNAKINTSKNKDGNFRTRSFDLELNGGFSGLNDYNSSFLARFNTGLFSFEFRRLLLIDPEAKPENKVLGTSELQFLMFNVINTKMVNMRLGIGTMYDVNKEPNPEFTFRFDLYPGNKVSISGTARHAWYNEYPVRNEFGLSAGYRFLQSKSFNIDVRGYMLHQNWYQSVSVFSYGAGLYLSLHMPKKNF